MEDREMEFMRKLRDTCKKKITCKHFAKFTNCHPNCEGYEKSTDNQQSPNEEIEKAFEKESFFLREVDPNSFDIYIHLATKQLSRNPGK